jgi:hypothetical protein
LILYIKNQSNPFLKGGKIMDTTKQLQAKKVWRAPELANYGTVERLTQHPKLKKFGPIDDFATTPSLTTDP